MSVKVMATSYLSVGRSKSTYEHLSKVKMTVGLKKFTLYSVP